jgi:hypothetical protein
MVNDSPAQFQSKTFLTVCEDETKAIYAVDPVLDKVCLDGYEDTNDGLVCASAKPDLDRGADDEEEFQHGVRFQPVVIGGAAPMAPA